MNGDELVIRGRRLGGAEITLIRGLMEAHPDWGRTRLSKELCLRWDWKQPSGQIKDIACRAMLVKLEQRGLITLPPRRRFEQLPAGRNRPPPPYDGATSLIACPLAELMPLRLLPAFGDLNPLFRSLVFHYHYLGLRSIVGENMRYLVMSRDHRPLACLLFGSAAWRVKARDLWIGWSDAARRQNLQQVTNNTRFLILPWVRVPHLASHLLALVCRRISRDWQERYGHPIHLLETFVERDRFTGTCYRAAGWIHVGATTGRSRNDRYKTLSVPIKDVWLRPLGRRGCEMLRRA